MDEHFQAAVRALLATGDPAANHWLNEFSSTPAAWEAALAVLEPGLPTEVQFFAANLLLTKTKSDWGKLSQDQRNTLALTTG